MIRFFLLLLCVIVVSTSTEPSFYRDYAGDITTTSLDNFISICVQYYGDPEPTISWEIKNNVTGEFVIVSTSQCETIPGGLGIIDNVVYRICLTNTNATVCSEESNFVYINE